MLLRSAFWGRLLYSRGMGDTLDLGLDELLTTARAVRRRLDFDIPFDRIMQTALSPLAYTLGTDFKPARGRRLEDALHVDSW